MMDILNYLNSILQSLTDSLSGGEPMAKGLITVGILGFLAHMSRRLPNAFMNLLRRKFIVSVEVENDDGAFKDDMFKCLSQFVGKYQTKRSYRFLSISFAKKKTEVKEIKHGPDTSSGFFFYNKRPYWYRLTDATDQGSVPSRLTLSTIGSDVNKIYSDANLTSYIRHVFTNRYFYEATASGRMDGITSMTPGPKLFLPASIKSQIDETVDFFINNRKWYEKRGLSYKLLIILHGKPGTGKSSIARYIADRLGWSLGTVNIPLAVVKAVRASSGRNMVLSVPDVDTMGIAENRGLVSDYNDDVEYTEDDHASVDITNLVLDDSTNATKKPIMRNLLGETLNLFQGDIPLNDSIVVMSTNDIDALDPALLRKGRCDLLIELKELHYTQMNEFFQYYYETEYSLPEVMVGRSIIASDLMGSFLDNPRDEKGFIESIYGLSKGLIE